MLRPCLNLSLARRTAPFGAFSRSPSGRYNPFHRANTFHSLHTCLWKLECCFKPPGQGAKERIPVGGSGFGRRCLSTDSVKAGYPQHTLPCTRALRNVAVIAHVDHGKTTLVDQLLKNSGILNLSERAMDSDTLEQERGITIFSKVTSFEYKDNGILYNIVDTPGHADFGGEVERVLSMVDGVLLIVDAQEGPMAQTKYVLGKALRNNLKPVVVLNKADRPDHRIGEVENEVFDLFANLDADDDQLDFPIFYSSAKDGWATDDPSKIQGNMNGDMTPILKALEEHISAPMLIDGPNADFRMLVTAIEPEPFVGRLVTGKVSSGSVKVGDELRILSRTGEAQGESAKVIKIFARRGMERTTLEVAEAGDIIQLAGFPSAGPTDTICSSNVDYPLYADPIDPPTISMSFGVNDSPLAGQEGSYLTAAQIYRRLGKEAESNVSLRVINSKEGTEVGGHIAREAEQEFFDVRDDDATEGLTDATEVQGRGELQLAILIENMRREGYELSISPPKVVFKKDKAGAKYEPYEELTLDIDEEYAGGIIEKMAHRKGELKDYVAQGGKARLVFEAPSRGLIGFQSEFKTDTKGTGIFNRAFSRYAEYQPDLNAGQKGSLVSNTDGQITSYALRDLEARGVLFVKPGDQTYTGMIIGEHTRSNDLDVNPVRAKKLTNVRASGTDEAIRLAPPKLFSLEEAITYIRNDDLLEVTPTNIRMRKKVLDPSRRKVIKRQSK